MLQNKFIKVLTEQMEYKEVPSNSKKYRKMEKDGHVLWIGKKGAIRSGNTISESRPIPQFVYNKIKSHAEKGA